MADNPETGSIAVVYNSDGSMDIWQLTDMWRKVRTVPFVSTAIDNHAVQPDIHHAKSHKADHAESGSDPLDSVGDIHFTNGVYAGAGDANKGKNETIIIPDVGTLTFKKGLLTNFEPVVPP